MTQSIRLSLTISRLLQGPVLFFENSGDKLFKLGCTASLNYGALVWHNAMSLSIPAWLGS